MHIELIFSLSNYRSTFVELNERLSWIPSEFMIQTSAIAQSGIIGVVCSVLGILNVFFCLAELIVSSKEIDKF
jgi:hypothetical protein